jgi:trehalose synthase
MPFIQTNDATILTTRAYIDDYVAKLPPTYFITPSIDPLSPKNVPLDENGIKKTLWKYKIDTDDPIITQVSRYDPWKDPLGVIDAYRLVKKEFPKVQLILAASMATDDPESWHYYEKTARRAGEDEDIFLLSNLQGVGNLEINAIQRGSDVVLQKSLQEGFGLTVTEALWKEKAVVGGNVGGIILQIDDGLNGYLVSSVEECAEKVIHLLKHPELAHQMGINGREKVREKFLCLTELEAYLRMLIAIQAGSIDAETNFS